MYLMLLSGSSVAKLTVSVAAKAFIVEAAPEVLDEEASLVSLILTLVLNDTP